MTLPLIKSTAPDAFKVLVADDSPVIRSVFQAFPASEILVRDIVADRQELLQAMTHVEALDAVLCADHLAGFYGGVHALNDLRAGQLLPHETAFILMSGDARKANLMVDIEARPDSILLKPFAPVTLVRKLVATVDARRALAGLRQLAQSRDWSELLSAATATLTQGTRYPAAVALFKMEALGQLGQHGAVRALYQSLLETAPNSPSILEAFARQAHQHGNLEEAEGALNRMLALQPANLFAADLLAEVLLAKGNPVAAQQLLQQALKHSPNSVQRHRVLGHLALLNNDTVTAQQAYLFAMRQHAEANGLYEGDVVNAVRSLLLHGDTAHAWRIVGDSRKKLRDSLALDVLERLTEALMYREYEAFGRTQHRISEGLALLDRTIMPNEGEAIMAATEASLMASLPHRAYRLSLELLNSKPHVKLHPAQKSWVERLHKWSRDVHNEDLPKGMLHYQKFMR
ncbi:hypothetical protein WJ96_06475 [Burkholderia ubonensis]|uniref:Response regulatory domain-containing protein n=1 Tax=Burkholderia ubonensis TaxID=101571 RepID=A0AAW3MY20_9BURK|nr:tetratricopeptide repeat protein [Burkholderia ubonensis]KVP98213.1 hypothetical protein WJ96_06475 [Burkholderia ubonensis]KVZ92910.1 hypothetical protein WL25_18135 [Burkholderia ubonensis]